MGTLFRNLMQRIGRLDKALFRIVGRGVFCSWVNLVILEQITFKQDVAGYSSSVWLYSIVSVVLFLVCLAVLAAFRPDVFRGRKSIIGASVVLPLGWLLCICSANEWFSVAGCVAMSAGSAFFMISWSDCYSRKDFPAILREVPGSMIVAAIVYYVLYGSNTTLEAISVVLLPLGAGGCLVYCVASEEEPTYRKRPNGRDCGDSHSRSLSVRGMIGQYWGFCLVMVVFSAMFRLVRELAILGFGAMSAEQVNRCIFIATLIVSLAILIAGFVRSSVSDIKAAALLVLPFSSIGLFLFSAAQLEYLGYFFVCMGYTLFDLLITVALFGEACHLGRLKVMFLGLGQLLLRIGLLVGTLIAKAMLDNQAWMNQESNAVFLICVIMVIAVTPVMYRWVVPQPRAAYEEGGMTLQEKIDYAMEKFHLTNREAELFSFIAQGRSVEYASKELHIAKSTAATHVGNLYKKIGASGKQEALDILDSIS